mmetsp:Transcript_73447/g.215414  ORF Transcript_73447/g.215414 Transcript_73447/m.215414 type:complete len:244 (+) Transcript_73447:224-955(+)
MAKGRGDAMPSSLARSTASGRPSAAAALLVTSSVTVITMRKSSANAPAGGSPAACTAAAACPESPEVCTACASPSALPMSIRRCQSTVSRTSLGCTQPPSMQRTESVIATRSMETLAMIVSARPMQKPTRGSRSMREIGAGMPATRVTRRKSVRESSADLGARTRAMSPMANRPSASCASLRSSSRSSSRSVEMWWRALEVMSEAPPRLFVVVTLLEKKDVSLIALTVKASEASRSGDAVGLR